MAISHKRETARRRPKAALIAGPLAVLATGVTVAVGVLGSQPATTLAADSAQADLAAVTHGATRATTVSRSYQRPTSPAALTPEPMVPMWTTDALNLWTGPQDGAAQRGELKARSRVLTTGVVQSGREEIVVDGRDLWVTQGYLAKKKPPADPAQQGLVFTPCGDMGVTRGLVPDMIRAYEAVCNAFPAVTSYGGLGPREEHNTGHAVDAMVYGDKALGQQIADFLLAHASELNLYDIIWYQHIWTPVRASEGWRLMPNRGSATANHMDHVHFAVN
ncbi:MAG TPA: mucin-2 protein [Nocardioides sp.]|nr:mucin-2 protein [Nocardioides sp.]